jgi:hypothetical protein
VTEWNVDDPDAAKVFYDLAEWDFEQQAEITAALAEAEVPHGWNGTELVVPEEYEGIADAIFADVERRLEVQGRGVPRYDSDEDVDLGEIDAHAPMREIGDDTSLTEYDLGDWSDDERALVVDSLVAAGIPSRWDGHVLLVPTEDEESVDTILDEVESGEIIPIDDSPMSESEEQLPFETLNSFFLAGERLQRDPSDANGLDRLLEALDVAAPNRPPRGVELRLWRRACELAEQLADAIAGDENEQDDAAHIAAQLHDLLRPLI